MNSRQAAAHMKAAEVYANLSYCNRRRVGCVIVKDHRIVSIGYNGTPPGEDNTCEDSSGAVTLPHVIHAEDNALRKLDHDPSAAQGAALFVTTAPCASCAKLIIQRNIDSVFYRDTYRSEEGIRLLEAAGIAVSKIE